MGLHDLGFKLTDAALTSIMAVIAPGMCEFSPLSPPFSLYLHKWPLSDVWKSVYTFHLIFETMIKPEFSPNS